MPKSVTDDIFEAILFLEEQYVSRQMRYSEFEALLDNVVPVKDYADTEVTAVYIELATNLAPLAMVFFKLYFDEQGNADSDWNVPLRRLARISGSGPDLGGGPIRLACRSQCAISWHQRDLWDPDMAPSGNDFQIIRRAITENKLGFEAEEYDLASVNMDDDEDIPVLTTAVKTSAPQPVGYDETDFIEEQEREHRNKLARLLRAQRLRIKTLNSQHEAEIEEVTRQNRIELQGFKNKLRDMEQTVQHNKVLFEQTKAKLQKRNNQFLALQEEIGKYKKKLSLLDKELSKALPAEEFENLKQGMEVEMDGLKEQLEQRVAELYYRDEREEQLKAEISSLKEQLNQVEDEDILNQLSALDVVYVVYHVATGHVTLSLKDVRRYMQNPNGFIAERCGVSEDNFNKWAKHNESSVCDICKKPITRVSTPADFVPGVSNRCEEHRVD